MTHTATFSVVTPNYNMARFLPETIESVLNNLRPGDEYFIIDGGSSDGSQEIIRSYQDRLTGWLSERDHGYADALAKGFRLCSGELLCWINSGDLLLDGALEAARQVLVANDTDLIFGDDVMIDETSRVIAHNSGYVRSLRSIMLFGGWTPLQDACYWRRSLYELVGGIDPNFKYAADYAFFLQASLAGKCEYAPKIFSAFRRHDGQKSVASARQYDQERHRFRRQTLRQQHSGRVQQMVAQAYYYFIVRWRHHIARRMHRQMVRPGTPIAQLSTR